MYNKEKFREDLIEAGVKEACKRMGFDFNIFITDDEDKIKKYDGYKWYVRPHSKVGEAVHAVPPTESTDRYPWEEWFILENKKIHNILFTIKKEMLDGEFIGEEDDKDHPKEVLGKRWYYFFDNELEPYLF